MAWSPESDVAALRDFAIKFDRPVVVTFSIDPDGKRFHVTSYGKSKLLCKYAGLFASQIVEAVQNGTIDPSVFALNREPEEPVPSRTWAEVES